jgi:tetratricopeptide (TPR) repeat protein
MGRPSKKSRIARMTGQEVAARAAQLQAPNPVNTESGLFAFDSQALTQLAVGSSVFIASVLAITDVIPLIPNATSVIGLVLQIIGHWIIAAVIWFLGFLAVTQTLRFISRGVWLTEKGLKLSRFDRVVPWTSIKAVAVEPNFFFTRLFSLKQTARRLTVLFHFEVKNKLISRLLFPNYIPSFFFSKETFDKLVNEVFARSQALPPGTLPAPLPLDYGVVATTGEDWQVLKRTYRFLDKQKIFVSAIILVSLVVFLGRKSMVYYFFNSAGKAATEARYEDARYYYQWSVKLEPTFAAGWNGLGQAEFRLAERRQANFDIALRDWRRAIFLKLDFVEPRLNIVRVCFYRRNFKEARALLEHASKLAPTDGLMLLEKAELDLYTGDLKQAQKDARLLLSEGASSTQNVEYIFKARCILAQAKLLGGDVAGAAREIEKFSSDPRQFFRGEDVTYLLITRAQILLAQGKLDEADSHIRLALRRQPYNQEVLIQAALVACARHEIDEAKYLLDRARKIPTDTPNAWLAIVAGRIAELSGNSESAFAFYQKALETVRADEDLVAGSYLKGLFIELAASSPDRAALALGYASSLNKLKL